MSGNVGGQARERILGVEFHVGGEAAVLRAVLHEGALVLAPSGPGLAVDWVRSAAYREALLGADYNLTDSGALLLGWRLRGGRRLPRLSGLGFLRGLLQTPEVGVPGATFWVMPNVREQAIHLAWLARAGVPVDAEDCYIAPHYGAGEIIDEALTAQIRVRRPRLVILAIGGGVQERLGWTLRRSFAADPARPGIACVGAAIAFLSGAQVGIPVWVDRFRLGWLWRLVSSPRRYGPRYGRALVLGWYLLRYGREAPPLRETPDQSRPAG